MIYYNNNDILIRDMTETDPQIITDEEIAQGWVNQKVEKYTQRISRATHISPSRAGKKHTNQSNYISHKNIS